MKTDKIILIILLGVLFALGCLFLFKSIEKEETLPLIKQTDALKIKEEYAKLNNQINEDNNREYPKVLLEDDNPFVISSEEEVISLLESGSGIIYFGYPSCAWNRSLIPVLESVAKEQHIGKIYYLDIFNIRDVLELDDNNKPIVKTEGTNGYYKILELLDKHLDTYYLTDKNNKKIDTLHKRLYSPTIVAVSNGEIKDVHVGTIKSQKSGYDVLSTEQITELKGILKELVNQVEQTTCYSEAC